MKKLKINQGVVNFIMFTLKNRTDARKDKGLHRSILFYVCEDVNPQS